MCGIAGFLDFSLAAGDAAPTIAERMAHALRHRGPDSRGVWVDAENGIALAHSRLAIIDLSPAGHQPMASSDGRYVVSFNGEIYNHTDVRNELAASNRAPAWRGHSDTETILAAISAWGPETALARLRGMFAFAVWDREARSLFLARDRIGEKPLYYGWLGRAFLFASELKALRCHPAWTGKIDRGALTLYMRHGYVPSPHCIHSGFRKLLPGCFLRIDGGAAEPAIGSYWSNRETMAAAQRRPFQGSPQEAVEGLHARLEQSVAEQMIADVPHGAFLSGGIDSSTIVALMQAQSDHPVRTFTIGFDERAYDEAKDAKAIARHLGTDHTELYMRPQEALDAVEALPSIYDEPFADSSQLPTLLLARMTAKHVKVALSGDGGDELFGGYERYSIARSLVERIERVPPRLRKGMSAGLKAVPSGMWDAVLKPVLGVMGKGNRHFHPGQKVHKWADFLSLEPAHFYRELVSICRRPTEVVIGGSEPASAFADPTRQPQSGNFADFMMALDLVSYLPDDILVKVDRAAMSIGLETRIPLLDPRVVDYAWSLPGDIKIRDGQSKWVLRQVLYRYLPSAMVDRPKRGFSVPIAQWLRGPLRPWAESLLRPQLIREQGILAPEIVSRAWQWYLAGDDEATGLIWNILMFQAWLANIETHPDRSLAVLDAA